MTDNIDGIYARQMEARLVELVKNSHRWDLAETNVVGQILTPLDLEGSPEQVKQLASSSTADALLVARATRGPNGVQITMNLFLASDGLLILQETLKDFKQYELRDILNQTESLYNKLVQKMPYSGIILSRQNNRVTLNLGKRDGLAPGTIVSAVLLIKANRHPKFNFLISSEREVLGKVKVEKVDETISFGVIVSEKSRGAIEKNTKVTGIDFIKYDNPTGFVQQESQGVDMSNDANLISFGKNAQEWIPTAPPTFGKVGLLLGFGSYNYNMSLESTGSLNATNPLFPSIRLDGELWLTPDWNILTTIRQGILNVNNPRSGSEPSNLSIAISRYSLYVARNILIKGDFFGPKVQIYLGWSKFSSFVDASTPLSLTSMSYSGLALGLKGEVPVDDYGTWNLGASLELFLSKMLTETPASSGSANSNTINSFSIYGNYKLTPRLRAVGSLDFESYTSTFSGDGTRGERGLNSSQRLTLLSGGIEYLF